MSNPDALKSIFEDPLDIEMEDLSKPKHSFSLKQSIQSLQSPHHQQDPIMALPIDPQPAPMVPTVVSELTAPTSIILPSLPSLIPTQYFLCVYNPRDPIIWERTWKL